MPHKVTTIDLVDEIDPDRQGRRRGQRRPAARGRVAAGRPVRRRRVRPRGAAQGLRPRRARRCSSSATAVSARPSRRRSPPPASARSACSTPTLPRPKALAERLRDAYPELEVTTGSKDPAGPRSRRQRDSARDEGRRPAADGRRPDRPGHVRRRGRDEAGDHAVPAGGAGQGLPDPGRQGHALRADPGLPGVLRLRHRHPGRAARRVPGRGVAVRWRVRSPGHGRASERSPRWRPGCTGWRCRWASTASPR